LLDHAEAVEDSVGMEIVLRHTAPTLLEMEVEIIGSPNQIILG
jgi:predicted thioesterase